MLICDTNIREMCGAKTMGDLIHTSSNMRWLVHRLMGRNIQYCLQQKEKKKYYHDETAGQNSRLIHRVGTVWRSLYLHICKNI